MQNKGKKKVFKWLYWEIHERMSHKCHHNLLHLPLLSLLFITRCINDKTLKEKEQVEKKKRHIFAHLYIFLTHPKCCQLCFFPFTYFVSFHLINFYR